MGKIVFVTFADSKYSKAIERIKTETEGFGFDKRYFLSEKDLPKDFFKGFSPKIYRRGYGYYRWKPYIVNKNLDNLDEGDILVYSDIGNQWHISGINRWKGYLSMLTAQCPIVAFQQEFLEKDWTNGDAFRHIYPNDWKKYGMTLQLASGMFLIYKCNLSASVFQKWENIALHYPLLFTDKASISPNCRGFQENRHDQSIFSLLVKQIPHAEISWEEIEPLDDDWSEHDQYPLWAKREKNELMIDKVKRKLKQCYTFWIGLYLKWIKGFHFRNKVAW